MARGSNAEGAMSATIPSDISVMMDIDHEESDSDADSWEDDDEPLAQRAARVATGKQNVTKLPGQNLMQLQFTDALLHQAVDVSWQNQDGREQVIQHPASSHANLLIPGVQGDIGPTGHS